MKEKTVSSGLTNGKTGGRFQVALWSIVAVCAILFVVSNVSTGTLSKISGLLGVFLISVLGFMHGTQRYGLKTMLIFFGVTFAISWGYETLSIYTGFPFGNYYYTDNLGPKIGVVPIFIMPAYFAVAYLSWTIAQVLLDRQSSKFGGADVFTIPFFSAFIMVIWDLCFDPFSSTINKAWIWEDGGGFFGVPIENYLGWFLCTYTFFQLFALYLKFCYYKKRDDKTEQTRNLWLLPCIAYGVVALQHLLVIFGGGAEAVVTSLDGRSWIAGDIKETLATVCIFTMIFISALSSTKVLGKARD